MDMTDQILTEHEDKAEIIDSMNRTIEELQDVSFAAVTVDGNDDVALMTKDGNTVAAGAHTAIETVKVSDFGDKDMTLTDAGILIPKTIHKKKADYSTTSKRKTKPKSVLYVYNNVERLVKYLFNITSSQKQFPKSVRYTLADRIRNTALDLFIEVSTGISVTVRKKKDCKFLHKHVNKARDGINALVALINLASKMDVVNIKNLGYIAELMDNANDAYKYWRKAALRAIWRLKNERKEQKDRGKEIDKLIKEVLSDTGERSRRFLRCAKRESKLYESHFNPNFIREYTTRGLEALTPSSRFYHPELDVI